MARTAKLYVFHPSPYMVEEIDSLLAANAADIDFENVVVPELLDEAMSYGIMPGHVGRVKKTISQIPQEPKSVILCSCSTFGGCAEDQQSHTRNPIIRIDRPMAEAAVETGRKIGVAAALESTIGPTTELLKSVASMKSKQIEISEILCASAWERRQNGDKAGYINEIVTSLEKLASEVDVIVLAQGSMAPAADKLTHLSTPILTSPGLAIERVAEMCRNLAA